MGYFEANPTFLEPEGDLVFGLYDIDMEAAAPYLEASMRVFPALARVVIKSCGERDCDHPVVTFYQGDPDRPEIPRQSIPHGLK